MNVTDTSLPSGHFLPSKREARCQTSETFVVGSSSRSGPSDTGRGHARYRASRVKKRTPEQRLARALVHGTGHVAVIGRNIEDAGHLLDEVIEGIETHRVVRIAADADNETVARALLGGSDARVGADSANATRSALTGLLEDARREHSPILVIADGADSATAEQLDRLRLALEFAPEALGTVRLVLLGTPSLERTLSKPSARSLASRISARVQAPAARRAGTALLRRFSNASRSARVMTLSTAAAASIALMLPLMADRSSTVPDPSGIQAAWVETIPAATRSGPVSTAKPARSEPSGKPVMKPDTPEPKLALAAAGLAPARLAPPAAPRAAPTAAVSAKPAAAKQPKVSPGSPVSPKQAAASNVPGSAKPAATTRSGRPTPAPSHKVPIVVTSSGRSPAPPAVAPGADVATYALQVGSFRNAANAARLEHSLAERFDGIETTRFERDGVVYHRVRLGALSGRPAAERTAAELTALGLEPLRIRTSAAAEQ